MRTYINQEVVLMNFATYNVHSIRQKINLNFNPRCFQTVIFIVFYNLSLNKRRHHGKYNTWHFVSRKKEKKLIMVNCQKGGKLASANGYGV